jgi:hypothetical protein
VLAQHGCGDGEFQGRLAFHAESDEQGGCLGLATLSGDEFAHEGAHLSIGQVTALKQRC